MKKYFKKGLGALIPITLVIGVVYWLYGVFKGIVVNVLPNSLTYQWWFVLVLILAITVAIFVLGLLVSLLKPIKPLRWLKKWFDLLVKKIPLVGTVYNFGTEIADSFVTDIKEDGDLQVVEIMFSGQKTLGLLNDKINGLVFIPTAPNPLNGFLVKTQEYKETDITAVDFLKMLASLGKINGEKWV